MDKYFSLGTSERHFAVKFALMSLDVAGLLLAENETRAVWKRRGPDCTVPAGGRWACLLNGDPADRAAG